MYSTEHFDKFNAPALTFTWEMIREINEDSYRAGLPDQTDPKAIEIMNQMSVKHWYDPLSVFLVATHRLVRDMLHKQLDEVFLQYHQTGLYRELKRIIEGFLYKLRAAHFEHAQENFNIEYNKPFTLALSALDQSIKSAYIFLAEKRRFARASSYLDAQGKYPRGDARREAELKKLTDVELGRDQFSQELTMMAVSWFHGKLLALYRLTVLARRVEDTTTWRVRGLLIRFARACTLNCSQNVVMTS